MEGTRAPAALCLPSNAPAAELKAPAKSRAPRGWMREKAFRGELPAGNTTPNKSLSPKAAAEKAREGGKVSPGSAAQMLLRSPSPVRPSWLEVLGSLGATWGKWICATTAALCFWL